MEYIVFCDEANKAYEVQRGNVCPACGNIVDDALHVSFRTFCNSRKKFKKFMTICKKTKGNHCRVAFAELVLK